MPIEFPMRGERMKLTPAIRASLPGDFIYLPGGVTHFQCEGPEDAPPVVLVHGFSVPYFIWDPTWEMLLEAGYRVLRYDLFGRGYSDRPFASNDHDLFAQQLCDLLDVLGIGQVQAVFGLSMGGLVAAIFARMNPERVSRLGLFDPAGYLSEPPFYLKLLRVPILGELFFGLVGESLFRRLAANDFYDPAHIDQFSDQFMLQMAYKGFRRSLLSTLRSGILESGEKVYGQIGGMDIPVLLVWGERDLTAPFEHSKNVVEAIPQVQFFPIAGSGHIPHYEDAERVNRIILEFLKDG
jgi:pimeloyl-ACP methyl ester carboxylesterase